MSLDRNAVAVGLLVLLAGCGGAFGGATPASEAGTAQASPPGVNETSVEPLELANAHGSTLSATSYETNHTTQVTFTNGTVYAELSYAGTVADTDSYAVGIERRGAWTPIGGGPRVAYYADDGEARRLTVGWNGTRSVSPARGSTPSAPRRFGFGDNDRLYQLLVSADETSVATATETGWSTEIEVSGAQPIAPSYVSDPGPANATLQVTSEGVVTKLVVRYDATVDGERVQVRTTVSYDAVGEATVDRPDWVESDG